MPEWWSERDENGRLRRPLNPSLVRQKAEFGLRKKEWPAAAHKRAAGKHTGSQKENLTKKSEAAKVRLAGACIQLCVRACLQAADGWRATQTWWQSPARHRMAWQQPAQADRVMVSAAVCSLNIILLITSQCQSHQSRTFTTILREKKSIVYRFTKSCI